VGHRHRATHRDRDLTTQPATARPGNLDVEEPAQAGRTPMPTSTLPPRPTEITAHESTAVDQGSGMSIMLGTHPTDVPEPFASLIKEYLAARPNLRTGAGPVSPWLFPSTLAGRHLHPNTVMDRLRDLGVNLLGARNRAIGELVLECPPSLVADALGYSSQVAFLHADKAAEPWARYAGRSITSR